MSNLSKVSLSVFLPETCDTELDAACRAAIEKQIYSVSVPPTWIERVSDQLRGSSVKTTGKISFPLGVDLPEQKFLDCLSAIRNGAEEIDMVCNMGTAKSENLLALGREVTPIVNYCHSVNIKVNAIIEMHLLSIDLLKKTINYLESVGVDRIAPSAGFKGMKMPIISSGDVERLQSFLKSTEKIKLIGFGNNREDLQFFLNKNVEVVETDNSTLLK